MAHTHHSPSDAPRSAEALQREKRALGWMVTFLVPAAIFTLVALVWLWPRQVSSHIRSDTSSVMVKGVTLPKGTITLVNQTPCEGMTGSVANDPRPCATISVHLDEGPEQGQVKKVPLTAAVYASGVHAGDKVKLYRTPSPQDGSTAYQFADFQRGMPLLVLALLFAVLVVAVARWRGFASLLGLVFAGFMVWEFMLPAMIVGHNPVLVGLTASSAIMFVVLYTAHGFSTRTTTALVGTLSGLLISALLGVWATRWAHLTGVASEDDFLLASSAPDLRLHSVVMCGVVLAGLGVLNDVTITQASAVWELSEGRRNPRELFTGAMRIGRDHIASTVYTTAFATAGAILSVLLLLNIYQRPLLETATSEMFAGELVRTLVGAIGLVLAVPVTTAIAVAAVTGGRPRPRKDEIRPVAPDERLVTVEQQERARAAQKARKEPLHKPSRGNEAAPETLPARGSRARRAAHEDTTFRRPSGPDEM